MKEIMLHGYLMWYARILKGLLGNVCCHGNFWKDALKYSSGCHDGDSVLIRIICNPHVMLSLNDSDIASAHTLCVDFCFPLKEQIKNWLDNIHGWKRFILIFIFILFFSICVYSVTHSCLNATPWTVAHQAPLSMGFSRQESWSGLPFPPQGELPNSGTEPVCLASPAQAGEFFTLALPGKSLSI